MEEQQDWMVEYVSGATDAVVRGVPYTPENRAVSDPEAEALRALIGRLHTTLVPVEPSLEFATGLYADLLANERGLARVRQLPWRVRIVATVLGVVGFWLLRRRFRGHEIVLDDSEVTLPDSI
jgi:type VI protein secretion system component VasF